MKNFEITDKTTGKKYWVSRSITILALVVVKDDPIIRKSTLSTADSDGQYGTKEVSYIDGYRKKYVLVNKRGEGTPNYQGYWNLPVGYLDFDETLSEACTREVMEEQGVFIPSHRWILYPPIDDEIKDGDTKQNVTVRFRVELTMDEYERAFSAGHFKQSEYQGENNEVKDRELMLLTSDNLNAKKWAFNHKDLLELEMKETVYIY